LSYLRVRQVGPVNDFTYEPFQRLNVITGDNSLGKTFLLEAAWAALTGEWAACSLLPNHAATKSGPRIDYGVATRTKNVLRATASYDWERQQWKPVRPSKVQSGLAIFARYDGSFAVWDPARAPGADAGRDPHITEHIVFKKEHIWDGRDIDVQGRKRVVCNGLVRDWVAWQTGKSSHIFDSLVACLHGLSPGDGERLRPGQPVRLPFDSRDFPTLTMPYGDVPIVHASAGIQRIAALAYFLVWSWHEHMMNCELSRREPQRRIILLVDEIEAHLHPRWQREIVPALVQTVAALQTQALPQVHIATHSPMVMASLEAVFDEEVDALWHLTLKRDFVGLDQLEFVKRGPSDMWLMSEVFGLEQPRSLPAEKAMSQAKDLQMRDSADRDQIAGVHAELKKWLAQDDAFWPRWLFWAKQKGVEI